MSACTESGDYRLPTALQCVVANRVINLTAAAPRFLCQRLLNRHGFYQAFDDTLVEGQQGVSRKKWNIMQNACGNLRGKAVLDIGCAEGFFCRQAALNGAARVVGVDSRLGTLLAAKCIALKERLPIIYKLGVFPSIGFNGRYDVIFCLSVLHHTVSTKDIWKVLNRYSYASDLQILRDHLASLRRMTQSGGICIIEMPYEYDDVAERAEVDFDRFASELISAGFGAARQLGSWEHREEHRGKKDRVLYVADAT
jgi:SAM-dependent methyltransferase